MWYGKYEDDEPAPRRRSSEDDEVRLTARYCNKDDGGGLHHRCPDFTDKKKELSPAEVAGALKEFSDNLSKVRITGRGPAPKKKGKKKQMLEEAKRLIQWADSATSGPSALNTELQNWLKKYKEMS
jgi:hypothetical protein